jgi:hypothetical protein
LRACSTRCAVTLAKLGALLAGLSLIAIVALSRGTPNAQVPRVTETLKVNVTRGDYRESDGTIVLTTIASNSTNRDAVITAAHLVDVSIRGPFDVPSFTYKQTGKLPRFQPVIVGGGKSAVIEVVSEVDLEGFYTDDLEPTFLPADQRANAREGRLFLEVRATDGLGKNHHNIIRVGKVGVFKENGKYVRPYVITNSDVLDAFTEDDVFSYLKAELKRKTADQ